VRGRYFLAAAAIVVALCATAPAYASDVSTLQEKVRAALRSAKSFVATAKVNPVVTAPNGGTIVYTVVAPNRYRQTVTGFPGADDTIIIGNKIYGNSGGGWDVQTWSDKLVNGFEGDLLDFTIVSIGDESTSTTGTFIMIDPHGAKKTDTMQCTYDKATSRPMACIASYETVTFARYDDPTVTIPTPPNAKKLDR
jgi:hypothetical protein